MNENTDYERLPADEFDRLCFDVAERLMGNPEQMATLVTYLQEQIEYARHAEAQGLKTVPDEGRSADYASGKWVGSWGWVSSHPVAKVIRKHPFRHGDEVKRGTVKFSTTTEARVASDAWASRLNAEQIDSSGSEDA